MLRFRWLGKMAFYRNIFVRSWCDRNGRDQAKAALRWERIYLRKIGSTAMDPWKVMPAPFGLINLGRESGKTE
jgi:hypothetical protein